jgi:hypothetical protein
VLAAQIYVDVQRLPFYATLIIKLALFTAVYSAALTGVHFHPAISWARLTGKSAAAPAIRLSSPFRKNISVFPKPESLLYPPPSRPTQRGVSRSSRT